MADVRVVIFATISLIAGYQLWKRGSRARSLIRGTATSKVATAPKGYVELSGAARPAGDAPLLDPVTDQPCLWFAVVTERFSWSDKMRWKEVKRAQSHRAFVLDDGTAQCLISPREADLDQRDPCIVVKQTMTLRHKVWWIRRGDPLYAIGHLERLPSPQEAARLQQGEQQAQERAQATQLDQTLNVRTAAVLKSWKSNRGHLVANYDADGDGQIDAQEWEVARAAARAQAAKQLASEQPRTRHVVSLTPVAAPAPAAEEPVIEVAAAITHRLTRAPDGRPFLVSTHGEGSLARRKLKHSLGGMLLFLFGGFMLLGLLAECVGTS